MQLYLLRHAHAGDPAKWTGPDEVRPLSEKGRLQADTLGRFLAQHGFHPDCILSSPKSRALETATIVAGHLGLPARTVPELGGPLDAGDLEALLVEAGDPGRPVLVGHDPAFSELAAELVGLDELPLRKGALVRLDLDRPLVPGTGLIRWLIPPDLLDPGDRAE